MARDNDGLELKGERQFSLCLELKRLSRAAIMTMQTDTNKYSKQCSQALQMYSDYLIRY